MGSKKKWTGQKGSFGDTELPVAKVYPDRAARNKMLALGGALIAIVLGVVAFDELIGRGSLASNGPLSSNHAAFGDDCAHCRRPPARLQARARAQELLSPRPDPGALLRPLVRIQLGPSSRHLHDSPEPLTA